MRQLVLRRLILISLLCFFTAGFLSAQSVDFSHLTVGLQADGSVITPTNQRLTPAGFQVGFPGRPVDLVLGPKERYLYIKNKSDIVVIRINDRAIMQTLPMKKGGNSFVGLLLSKDGKKLYTSDARQRVWEATISKDHILNWSREFDFEGPKGRGNAVPAGMAFSPDGKSLLVCLSRNNSLGVVNLSDKTYYEIPVGIAPYTVLVHPSGKIYVSNWGGRRPQKGEPTAETSGSQVLVNPKTGIASSGTISIVDLAKNKEVGSIPVCLHPSGMAFSHSKNFLFVANANSDTISVINTKTDSVVEAFSVRMRNSLPFGSAPNALVASPDDQTLYVANGTDNAIAVVALGQNAGVIGSRFFSSRIIGMIPTGWYPGAVITNRRGNFLYVANVKGLGSLNKKTTRLGFNSHDHLGSVSIIPVPDRKQLAKYTKQVEANNDLARQIAQIHSDTTGSKLVPIPIHPGEKSVFKHVVYIIKENRTYDQVLGDMFQANGDTNLVMFGRKVTPNHHKLAEDFVLMDNFYCSGVLSADGHQWTDEAYVTDYLEKSFGDFSRSYPYDGDDALAYASSGFIWDRVLKKGLTFRDYGEFVRAEIKPKGNFLEIYDDFVLNTGKFSIRAKANLKTLEPYLCPNYIGFPNTVSDIYRASVFIKELKQFEANNNFPNFIIMLLPNDHTSGTRPGRPTPDAAVADNDLALGKIVEAISHSKFWKETAIFVTEDDPQDGLDHVDGHRTVGFVISPYTKRGKVVSTYYTQISMVRTIEQILGLKPMNQFDLVAEPMTDCFTDSADFTPYESAPNNIPLTEINPQLESLNGEALHWAKESLKLDLDDVDRADENTFNRILWFAAKGPGVPYPAKK